jgi:O-antigen/teichoic acid export membrane protein
MARTDHITGPAFLLVVGRTVGVLATFAILPIFARIFSVEDIGTYKTFFLVFATVYGLAQLGMAESLYYFVPQAAREQKNQNIGRYACNAAISLALAGAASTAVLWGARANIAEHFDNPAVADIAVLVGLFVTFMLVGTVLEIVMVSRKQHMSAAITYAVSDIARTALFLLPALVFASLRAVFIGAVIFAAVRLATMLTVLWRQFGREFRPDLVLWRTQLAYALPFALAVGVEVIMIYYHQFVVGGAFDTATFAIYATGCMSIPLVDLVVTSTTSVMMVKMAEVSANREESLALFHDTVARLTFLLFPLTVALVVLAQPFIITLYTDVYARSVPVFVVWSLTILPMMFAVDGMLRAYAQTRFLLVMNLVRFGVVASIIGALMQGVGLVGAVLATLAALTVSKGMGLFRVAHVMGVPMSRVVPWATLARIGGRALAAAIPAWLLAQLFASTPWLAFVSGGMAYAIAYLVLCYAPGIAEPAAIRLPIIERAQQLGRGLAARFARAPKPLAKVDASCAALTGAGLRGDQ